IGVGAALVGNGSVWLAMTPDQAMTSVYGSTLFSDARAAAGFIKGAAANPGDIAVLGSEPEIYFYSRLPSATGYIYMYPLMEQHPFARQMQDEMIAQIE